MIFITCQFILDSVPVTGNRPKKTMVTEASLRNHDSSDACLFILLVHDLKLSAMISTLLLLDCLFLFLFRDSSISKSRQRNNMWF